MTRIRFAAAAVLVTLGLGTLATTASTAHATTSPTAARATTQTLRVVTANLDALAPHPAARAQQSWTNQIEPNADVAFLQEAKNVRLGSFIDTSKWIILHGATTDELKNWQTEGIGAPELGTAIVIRRSAVQTATLTDYALVKGVSGGWGCRKISASAWQIQTRWIAKVKIHLANGRYVRLSSLHMPPARCAAPKATVSPSPYAVMANNVVSFVKLSTMPTILGADWNLPLSGEPTKIAARTGSSTTHLRLAGSGIDGLMYSRAFTKTGLRAITMPTSDHPAVQMTVTVAAP